MSTIRVARGRPVPASGWTVARGAVATSADGGQTLDILGLSRAQATTLVIALRRHGHLLDVAGQLQALLYPEISTTTTTSAPRRED